MKDSLVRLVGIVERLGANPGDSSDIRLHKTILVASALMMSMGGIVWGTIFVAFSEPWASAVPFGYVVITLINITAFRLFDRFRTFRLTHILTSLLLPFFLMVALGGFIDSGAVVFWSLVAPVGAVLVTDRRERDAVVSGVCRRGRGGRRSGGRLAGKATICPLPWSLFSLCSMF